MRNGFRARTLQTAEGELSVEIPQVREAAAPFVSRLFPRGTKLLRTEPLKGVGDRRVRAWPVDARRRVTVRGGRAGQCLEGQRGSAPSCATVSNRSSAAISTRSGS